MDCGNKFFTNLKYDDDDLYEEKYMQRVQWGYQFYLETTANLLKNPKSSNTQNCPIFNFFLHVCTTWSLMINEAYRLRLFKKWANF